MLISKINKQFKNLPWEYLLFWAGLDYVILTEIGS